MAKLFRIENLDFIKGKRLNPSPSRGPSPSRNFLQESLGPREAVGRLIDQQGLKFPRVYRLRFEINDRVRSLVVKRLDPGIARRNQLVTERWLPAVGLSQCGPPLLGSAAERSGQCVWHVYEDLGDWTLDTGDPDPSEWRRQWN